MASLPESAEVIIVGGGIVGCSIAYHLSRAGVRDVVLLERKQLTSGTTWHAAGLVGQLRASLNMTRLAQYTAELFGNLEAETGQHTGYRRTGSLTLALNGERLEELRRQASMANAFGVTCDLVDTGFIREHWPDIETTGVAGGVYLPGDGQTNPVDTTLALARGARNGGAQIREGVCVETLLKTSDHITGVRTRDGQTIRAKTVVLATGMWSRELGARHDVSIPLHAAEHFYLVTEPMAALNAARPTLRVPDEHVYYKVDTGKILLGCFEPVAKPWGMDGIPDDFEFGTLPDDYEHFEPVLNKALLRYPALADAGISLFFNGPESFTPDDRYLLGETPELDGLFVACGFNSIGIQSSGGAGKVLADWIVKGHPSMDLWDVDIKRMFPFQSDQKYLYERTTESLGLLYAMHWPYRQYETARDIRLGPLHERLLRQGAVMGERAGWERPDWYARDVTPVVEYTYGKPNWFESCSAECAAIEDGVALFDQASYPVFDVEGRDAARYLNMLCANEVDVAEGAVVYTQWLNSRGGIEADVTITRFSEMRFMVVSSCAQELRDFHWLTRHAGDFNVTLHNLTEQVSMIGIMGPDSRKLLDRLTNESMDNASFPYYTSKTLTISGHKLRANRLSYVGELGYELYIPWELTAVIYDLIVEEGSAMGMVHAGFHAMNACRIEKAYKHWGHDIHDHINPYQAGLGFAVKLNKPAFIGKDALTGKKGRQQNRLVSVKIDVADAPFLIHDEPILMDGKIIGLTTSGMWGHRVNRSLGIASLTHELGINRQFVADHSFEIEVAGERYPVDLSLGAFYDPDNSRLRS